jgi:hypothetical protein
MANTSKEQNDNGGLVQGRIVVGGVFMAMGRTPENRGHLFAL